MPLRVASQKASRPIPFGLIAPIPVTTIRELILRTETDSPANSRKLSGCETYILPVIRRKLRDVAEQKKCELFGSVVLPYNGISLLQCDCVQPREQIIHFAAIQIEQLDFSTTSAI